ncbi:GDYXXLXY domain-containing protein [Comamonas sp. GB3 AK4-5]|uniref:GDYXXLXY domain-containing protein n=1 Tax=Comamonas sp. GB3 AK4-5 TaxID=3231487 RepID=UPI00351F6E24
MKFFSHTPSWWAAARAQGLVSDEAGDATYVPPDAEQPSLFVIALAMVGAAVCSALLIGLLFLGFDLWRLLENGSSAVVLGMVLMVGALVLIKSASEIFSLCLALVLLGAGLGIFLVGWVGWSRHALLELALAGAVVAGVQVLAASMTAALWMRQILGAVCGVALYTALVALMGERLLLAPLHPAAVLLALAWAAWVLCEPRWAARAQALGWAVFVDAVAVGLVAVLLGGGGHSLAWEMLRGMPELLGDWWLWSLASVVLTLLALAGLLWHWHQVGRLTPELAALLVIAGLGLAVCAWFSASVAVLAVIAAAAVAGARWRMLALCAVGALWLLGQFYYWIGWPLAYKGLVLALLGAGLLLGIGLVRVALRHRAVDTAAVPGKAAEAVQGGPLRQRHAVIGVLLGAALVFGLVNWDVARKEAVIAKGQPILVPLVPVDPRSIMQGDYMSLRFDLPYEVTQALDQQFAATAPVVASLDAQGQAQVLRLAQPGELAGAGEILLPLKRLKGQWVLVSDAYFFPEGQGERFEKARFGDFRVLPDGRALLVGLADDQGQPIAVETAK